MPSRLFLSYARADDEPFVEKLFHDLKRLGYEPWYDRHNMTADGAPFSQVIDDAICACDRLLFIVGPRSVASLYCAGEWQRARKLCKPIVPLVRLGDFNLIPAAIGQGHAVDARAARDYNEFINELHRLCSDPVRPVITPAGAPALPAPYIERPQHLEPLKAAIRAGDPLLTITARQESAALVGIGGIGKTTLAIALCMDCDVRRTFDHIFWLEAGSQRTLADAPGLLRAVGAYFGDPPDSYQDLNSARASLTRHLDGRKTLIVLDDVWDAGLPPAFRFGGADCRLLVTTRSKTIAGAGAQQVDQLSPDEGAQLIAGRTGRPGDPVYRQISQMLGGHTLAVALAAAQIANGYADAADLLRLLEKRAAGPEPFQDLALDATDRNRNLALSLSFSYELLGKGQGKDADDERRIGDDLRRCFRALGALAPDSTFDRAALAALWGDADPDDARRPLAALEAASLIETAADKRYSQHRLLRAYARGLLAEAGEMEAASARHFHHYAGLHGDYDANNDEDRHPLIKADWANLQAALAWGFDHAPEPACDLAWALYYYMGLREALKPQREVFTQALASAERAGYARGQANTLKALGDLSVRLSELDAARGYYDRALPVYETIGARLGQANTLQALGDLSVRLSELDAARGYYDRALPVYETIGDRLGQANTLQALGDLSVRLDELDAARGYYDRALPVYETIGDRLGQANTLQALGT